MRGRPNGATHRFGEIAYDARTGELSTPSGTTRLTPQLATVLDVLIERPGELITREALHSRLWPAGTFVDFEHGLSALVSRLREALGDSSHEPGFIETLPRRGYRWLAPVERVPAFLPDCGEEGATALALAPPAAAPAEPLPEPGQSGPMAKVDESPGRSWRHVTAGVVAIATVLTVVVLARSILTGPAPTVASPSADDAAPVLASAASPGERATPPGVETMYNRGRLRDFSGDPASWRASVADLTLAVQRAPLFAPARAVLASVYVTGAYYGFIGRDEALRLSRAAALGAVRLDEGLADGQVALGDIRLFLDWDWDGARDAYAHALKIQPHHETALMGRAHLDSKAGCFDEAIATWNDLRAHDPASTAVALGLVAAYVDARRFNSAIEVLGTLDSRGLLADHRSRISVAVARVGTGDCHAALREADRAMALLDTGNDEVTHVAAAWIHATCGRPELARSLVARLDSPARSVKPDLISLAAVYGALGDTALAIDLLERGVAERSPVAVVLDVDFMLDPLRAHPAFERLAARVRGSRDGGRTR